MSDRTQDLKNLRAVATACKNYVDETKEQILWQVGQYNITTQDDNTTAYQKTVPTGATRAKIKSIGFMSYKSENLIATFNESTGTSHTFVDGVLTSTGIDSRDWNTYGVSDFLVYLKAGSYQIKLFDRNITYNQYQGAIICTENNTNLANIQTILSNESGNTSFTITNDGYYGIKLKFIGTCKPMLVSGSTEPTEWKEGFTGIRDSVVTSVKSYDSNNNLIDTYTIPSEIQALEGYGRGINENCYNVLDFETKEFTDKDGKKDLGTLNYIYVSQYEYMKINTNIGAKLVNSSTAMNALCEKYKPISQIYFQSNDKVVFVVNSVDVCIKDTDYTDATAFKTAMSGVPLQYELATYNITSNLELPDNVIEVEAGGYLVFENQYQQAVPSNITYRIEVES